MKYRVRCRKCRARRVLYSPPDTGFKKRPCARCGCRDYTLDSYRQLGTESARQTCHCDGLPFPHRKGSTGCRAADPIVLANHALREDGIDIVSTKGKLEL